MWSISYVTCVDIIAQVSSNPWSVFLFLDVSTQKIGLLLLLLLLLLCPPTDQNNSLDCPFKKKSYLGLKVNQKNFAHSPVSNCISPKNWVF